MFLSLIDKHVYAFITCLLVCFVLLCFMLDVFQVCADARVNDGHKTCSKISAKGITTCFRGVKVA